MDMSRVLKFPDVKNQFDLQYIRYSEVSDSYDIEPRLYGSSIPLYGKTCSSIAGLQFPFILKRKGSLFSLGCFQMRGVVSPQQVTGNIGDPKEVECSVTAAQAAANITWNLNGRDITSDAHAEIRPN
ncbi:unnamed protein product, partial [Meganyctiphanes norvegica]